MVNSSQQPQSLDPQIDKLPTQIEGTNEAKNMVQFKKRVVHDNVQTNMDTSDDSCDLDSVQGHFGWEKIGGDDEVIPYIIRTEGKYVSERMANCKLLFKYGLLFTKEIYEYTPIKMVTATVAEAKLLQEINSTHCDGFYGSKEFTNKDNIYLLTDCIQLYKYLDFCYKKLTKTACADEQRCGFIKLINDGEFSMVPYVSVEDKKMVPVFYFDDDCDYLEKGAVSVNGWHLAYLKFVCKIQGIRRVIYDKDQLDVVELEYLKKLVSPETKFEFTWEFAGISKCDLLRSKEETEKLQAQLEAAKKNHLKMPVIHARSAAQVAAYKRRNGPIRPNFNQQSAVQPQKSPTQMVHHRPPMQQGLWGMTKSRQQMHSEAQLLQQQQQRVPPPYPVTYSPVQNSVAQNGYSNVPAHLQPAALLGLNTSNIKGSKYYQIPETNTCNPYNYFLTSKEIDGINVGGCINMQPFNQNTYLVSLEELSRSLFHVDLEVVKNAVNVLRLDIYKPNSEQVNLLRSVNLSNTEGLIKLDSLYEVLPQLRQIVCN